MERDGDTSMIELNQTGFNNQITESLLLYVSTIKVKWKPAYTTTFIKDEYGEPTTG